MARILLADNDSHHRNNLREALEGANLGEVKTAEDGEEALALLGAVPFDLAAIEIGLPHLNGLEVLQAIRQKGIRTQVMILAGQVTAENAVQVLRGGAQDFLEKPVPSVDFVASVRRLLEKHFLPPHVLADRLNRFLKIHAARQPLRLSDLCRHFKISSGYATRLFRKHLGTTFTQCLVDYRLERAKDLLESTDTPMYLIAEQSGFKNSRRFSETFRRREGISPVKYRQGWMDRQMP